MDGYRYRREDGHFCVDLRLRRIRQIFDGRDPAPFHERDLDDHAVDYLVGAVEDLPRGAPFKVIVFVEDPLPPDLPAEAVIESIRAHFAYDDLRLARAIRKHVRRGQGSLVVGLVALVALLFLAEIVSKGGTEHVRQIVREGLVITGWVVMWRPLEGLLYGWWPLWSDRKTKRKLRDAPIDVRKSPP